MHSASKSEQFQFENGDRLCILNTFFLIYENNDTRKVQKVSKLKFH